MLAKIESTVRQVSATPATDTVRASWPIFRLVASAPFGRSTYPRDLIAGLTLAAIPVPEQMATIGFFAFAAGSVGFAIFGSNRFLSCGAADSTIKPIFAGGMALWPHPAHPTTRRSRRRWRWRPCHHYLVTCQSTDGGRVSAKSVSRRLQAPLSFLNAENFRADVLGLVRNSKPRLQLGDRSERHR
jgi:MFS superfamily sulfate permease-like transporter